MAMMVGRPGVSTVQLPSAAHSEPGGKEVGIRGWGMPGSREETAVANRLAGVGERLAPYLADVRCRLSCRALVDNSVLPFDVKTTGLSWAQQGCCTGT